MATGTLSAGLESSQRRAVIIGAGVAGVTAALALCKRDWLVQVFEKTRAESVEDQGIELSLMSPVTLCLEALGYKDARSELAAMGNALTHYNFVTGNGTVINRITTDDEVCHRLGFVPQTQLRRADLMTYLTSLLIRTTGREDVIKFDHSLTNIVQDTDGPVVAVFANGATYTADLLVGADGIRSVVRQLAIDQIPPTYSGASIIYGSIPGRYYLSEKEPHGFHAVMDDNFSLLSCSIGQGPKELTWWALVYPAAEPVRGEAYLWHKDPAISQHLATQVLQKGGEVAQMYLSGTKNFCFSGGFFKREVADLLHKWHCKRVVLVGDAVHGMLPWGGAGAAMATEDAFVLATELARATVVDMEAALTAYADARFHRVQAYMTMAETCAPNGLGQSSGFSNIIVKSPKAFEECPAYLALCRDGRFTVN